MVNSIKLCGLIGLATKAGRVVMGTDACLEAIEKRSVKLILLAQDASERTKTHFTQTAQRLNIPISEILSIEEMSKAMGKVNKAVIGIKDTGFSKKMISVINGGEDIG